MYRVAWTSLVMCCFGLGCNGGSDAPPTFPVSGTVTFDGAPVESGDIHFESDVKGEAPDSGSIVNGKYSLKAKEGKKKVKITASRAVPGKTTKGAMGEDIVVKEDYIPAKYNTNSELAETVEAVPNSFDFELKSDGKK